MNNLTIQNFDNASELQKMFVNYDRADNFSYEGIEAMYNFLMECCPDTVIDIIGLCCQFSEYDSLSDAAKEYGVTRREMRDNYLVIDCSNGHVLVGE